MKRLSILLALALLLSACSMPAPPTLPQPDASPAASVPPETIADPSPEAQETFPMTFRQTLADTEDCTAEVTAIGLDGAGNWVFHLRMENRAAEIQNFAFLYQSINGLSCESLLYRLAVGESVEREFRVLREALSAFGETREVQWSFTLQVSSAESNRENYFDERCFVCPAGESEPLRYQYRPGADDVTVMDNDYAAVYVTGVSREGEGLAVDFVAVNRTDAPLRLLLPPWEQCSANGRSIAGELCDDIAPESTLVGYIPLTGDALSLLGRVEELRFMLLLTDPEEAPDEELEGSSVWVTLRPDLDLN